MYLEEVMTLSAIHGQHHCHSSDLAADKTLDLLNGMSQSSSPPPAAEAPIAPEPSTSEQHLSAQSGRAAASSFQELSHLLDVRVLRALAHLSFSHPTPVQAQVLPLALAGSDVLARAQTGSGKTLAYGLPILQRVLLAKQAVPKSDLLHQATRALILVPTRELSEQVTAQLGALLPFLEKDIKIVNVARDASKSVHKILLAEQPDIVVSTPSRAYDHVVKSGSLSLALVETLAIDEADLILSYGHDEALRNLMSSGKLPKSLQCLCMSATMTQDVKALRGLVLKKPVVLDIADPELSTLTQYCVHVSSATDKYLLTYVILRLRLIRGKCIIFVNDTDRCYRLKLFLEQFGVKSTVLNEELPVNSRYHIVQEFNKGVYDYIIATDESRFGADAAEEGDSQPGLQATGEGKGSSDSARKAGKGSSEYGVSRGVDFVSVSCVLNFDLPVSPKGYTHRVGRTARAGKTGTSLSFVVPKDAYEKDARSGSHVQHLVSKTSERDEEVWAKIAAQEHARGQSIAEWKFDRKQVDAFRYRMEDGLRAVTKHAIREARIRELKHELLTSERLRAHFEDNPTDLEYLRHDKLLHPTRVQSHLKHIPSYLMPRIRGTPQQPKRIADGNADAADESTPQKRGRGAHDGQGSVAFVSHSHRCARGNSRGARGGGRGGPRGGGGGRGSKRRNDPLRSFGN